MKQGKMIKIRSALLNYRVITTYDGVNNMKCRESPAFLFPVCASSQVAISLNSVLQILGDKGRGRAINKANWAVTMFCWALQTNSILTS